MGTLIMDPIALLQNVAKYVSTMTRRVLPYCDCLNVDAVDDMNNMPFRYNHDNNDQPVDNLYNCHQYPDIAAKLYGGIFSCHRRKAG